MELQLGDFAVNPLLVVDERGGVLYANAAMEAVAGPGLAPGADLSAIPALADLAMAARRALRGEPVRGAEVRTWQQGTVVVLGLPAPGDAEEHARLLAAERRWRAVFDSAAVAMVEITLEGVIVAANPATVDLTGRPLGEIVGRTLFDLVDRRHRRALAARIAARAAGVRAPGPGLEMRVRRPDGEERWARGRGALTTVEGEPEGRVLVHLSDVTAERAHREEVEQARDQLAHEAKHDHLTGLPNRRALLEQLGELDNDRHDQNGTGGTGVGAGGPERRCAVLFVDLDGFKPVNDTLGHAAGDQLLVVVARRLLRSVRPGDTVARLGGDEFVVLARNVGIEEASGIAERVSEAVRAPFSLGYETVAVTCSIGIALTGQERAGSLLDAADAALYEAKETGRDRWWFAGRARAAAGS